MRRFHGISDGQTWLVWKVHEVNGNVNGKFVHKHGIFHPAMFDCQSYAGGILDVVNDPVISMELLGLPKWQGIVYVDSLLPE